MTRQSCTDTSAHVALREAARALRVAGPSSEGLPPLTEAGFRHLASDLADTLHALHDLLDASGLGDLPAGRLTRDLSATVQHLDAGSWLARRNSCAEQCDAPSARSVATADLVTAPDD